MCGAGALITEIEMLILLDTQNTSWPTSLAAELHSPVSLKGRMVRFMVKNLGEMLKSYASRMCH